MSLTNLKRWISASYRKQLRKLLSGASLFVEGEDRQTSLTPDHYELRIDGPYVKPNGTKGEYCAYIEVNILCNSTRDQANVYKKENLQGVASEALTRDFCIYKTGNEESNEADDGSLVGLMQLIPHEAIKTSEFGMIDPNTEVYQSVVEAHYEMFFSLR
jgi:hypothetical protein